MSDSQNKKNEQQNNLCTTNLTEQWKKGKLEGEYYIETTNGEIYNVEFQNSISVKKKKLLKVKSFKGYVHKKTVKEVLAPVPNYEEWQELKLHDEKATIKLGEKIIENNKLKELLKECKLQIGNEYITENEIRELYHKIDNAIGGK